LSGAGSLTLGGSNSYSGGTIVSSGTMIVTAPNALPCNSAVVVGNGVNNATLKLNSGTGTAVLSSLQLNPGTLVDIGNNAIAINYGAIYNDPIFDIVNNLSAGYNGGAWTGTAGIISTAAQNSAGPLVSVGYTDGAADANVGAVPNQILIRYTLAGDANLDGLVNFADLVAVIQNFQKFGTDWAHGDFTYSGETDFSDLVIVVQNFNQTLPGGESMNAPMQTVPLVSGTDVQLPEPGAWGAALVFAGALLARRKRRGILRK
jgi:autotransporter-associated beta strand protein